MLRNGGLIYVCGGHCITLKKRGSDNIICLWWSLHNAEKTSVLYMFLVVFAL